jgi:CPA2 family monovalent cation:H+ antiporter-2
MQLNALLADLAIIFCAGVVSVLLLARVGLPPVVGFLAAGLLIGPHALGLVADVHTIELIAELGVALLLFTIGLEFSFDRLRRIGRLVAVGGTLQVGLTVAGGALVATLLGAPWKEGVFWGYLAALSSTAIVLRALADRGETDAPHGRLVVGVLIFQDLAIVPMMLTVPLLAGTGGDGDALAWVLVKAAAVVIGVVGGARQIVPRLLGHAARARSREVFVLTVLLVAASVAWATSSMGLSIALGAFLAGVIVAETPFVHQALSEVSPFRDALASLFFVSVGMLLDPRVIVAHPLEVGGIVLLLVAGKLALAMLAVLIMRFPARVAIAAGLALAQVGEFSFVLLRVGQEGGLIADSDAANFLAASVVTMIAAPLLLTLSPRLAAGAALLRPLERLFAVRAQEEPTPERALRDHVVVAGLGHGGRSLLRGLRAAQIPCVGLELDPETVISERAAGHDVRYGDATSLEVLEHVAHVAHARQVVLLMSDVGAAGRAANLLRSRFPHVPVLARVHRADRDRPAVDLPGVQVISEDEETAIEVVERVLRASGVTGTLIAGAVRAAQGARGQDGAPLVPPDGIAGAMNMQAMALVDGDRGVGSSLAGLDLRGQTGALVVAHARAGVVLASPPADAALVAGDTLFLVGTPEQLAAAVERLTRGEGVRDVSTTRVVSAVPGPTPPPGTAFARYALAVLGPVAVTGLLAFLHATTSLVALTAYVVAVVFAGAFGGAGPAALAAALAFVLGNMTFIEPIGRLTLASHMWPFAAMCLLAAGVGAGVHRARGLRRR